MRATEALSTEHRAIERILRILTTAAAGLDRGQDIPPATFERLLDFLRNFADRCHHGKEETLLFPALVRKGISKEGGPVGVMLEDHEAGRRYIRGLSEAVEAYKRNEPGARDAIARNARGYADVLTRHIFKEDHVLFRMADQVLTPAEQEELVSGFERIEDEEIGAGVHESYHRMIGELEKEFGLQEKATEPAEH